MVRKLIAQGQIGSGIKRCRTLLGGTASGVQGSALQHPWQAIKFHQKKIDENHHLDINLWMERFIRVLLVKGRFHTHDAKA
ncbi:hypothetical protein ACEWPL_000685 [Roseovarius sp. S1116L3]|uniref:hypothetical protein n=1 Tax=Roseovarius roseus TaxID=3342636 RepID=UPI00372CB438